MLCVIGAVSALAGANEKQIKFLSGLCFDPSAGGSVLCGDDTSVWRIKNGEW
jgi:hypothetical protein